MSGHRRVARGAEAAQELALSERAGPRRAVVEPGEPRAHDMVVGPDLHGEHALPHRGHEGLRVERLHVARGQSEALEAGRGENHTVPAFARELSEPRVHVAANGLDDQIGPQGQRQRAAARAPGADPGAGPQALEAPGLARYQDVARVFPLGKRGEDETRGELSRQILETMHGAVDRAAQEHLLDLSHEQPFSSDPGQLDLLPPIALGPYGHELDLFPSAGKIAGDAACLRERELTAPGPDPDHCSEGLEAGLDRGWPETDATRLRSAVNPSIRIRSARSFANPGFIRFVPGRDRRARGRARARSVGSRHGRIPGAW